MRLKQSLPAILLLGLLSGCSQSGKSGSDPAKKYTNPDENKQGGGQGGAQGGAMTGEGKADSNSGGGPAANMSNSSNSDDAQTTKHQPGMSGNDQPQQQKQAGTPQKQ